jgi:hypothetical protein
VIILPATSEFESKDPCFRPKDMSSYLSRLYRADMCYHYWVGEGSKFNYKDPPKMNPDSMPQFVPLDEWAETQPYVIRGDDHKQPLLPPSEWPSLYNNSVDLPASFVASPVKKRTFRELMTSPKSTPPNSPYKASSFVSIKVEATTSSSSSSSSKGGLFSSTKK